MLKTIKIFLYSMVTEILIISAAQAFFPIPIPLIGSDLANNVADWGENLNAAGEEIEQTQATIQKTIEQVKSGSFGLDAIKGYANTINSISLDRIVPDIQLPGAFSKDVNNQDKMSEAVTDVYTNTLSPDGNHMAQAQENKRRRTELLQMNVSAMYAHALANRVNLAQEREMPATTLESKNTREILQSNRALSEKIAKRWNEILFMESQQAEYNATKILTGIHLDSERASELNIGNSKSDKEGES